MANRSGIHIKRKNKGKMRRTAGAKRGQKIPISRLRRLARSSNPTTKRRAVFALNVRRGKIGGGRKKR